MGMNLIAVVIAYYLSTVVVIGCGIYCAVSIHKRNIDIKKMVNKVNEALKREKEFNEK